MRYMVFNINGFAVAGPFQLLSAARSEAKEYLGVIRDGWNGLIIVPGEDYRIKNGPKKGRLEYLFRKSV